jgi:hypothetical protein
MKGEKMPPSSVQELLLCPISCDVMEDPVMLLPSGMTYDRKQICKSLLQHPNLDPSSGVRYDSKLQYCHNLAVRQLLMETYGDKAFKKYDDSGFQTRYEKAWNSGNVGEAAKAALLAAEMQTREREREHERDAQRYTRNRNMLDREGGRERERERDAQRWTHNRVMLALFQCDGLEVWHDGTLFTKPIYFACLFVLSFLVLIKVYCFYELYLQFFCRPPFVALNVTWKPARDSIRNFQKC